jgi:hypothetical protein
MLHEDAAEILYFKIKKQGLPLGHLFTFLLGWKLCCFVSLVALI